VKEGFKRISFQLIGNNDLSSKVVEKGVKDGLLSL
jgi:hypothetical protein